MPSDLAFFVIESDAGVVVPIEAKSGRNARAHAVLNNLLATKEYELDLDVVFSRLNVERNGKVLYLPWYAIPFTGRAIGSDTHDTRGLRMSCPPCERAIAAYLLCDVDMPENASR